MTVTEIEDNILKINSALSLLYAGKAISKLSYTDDGIERTYEYQKLNIPDLIAELGRLNLLLANLKPVPITYTGANSIELYVGKRI